MPPKRRKKQAPIESEIMLTNDKPPTQQFPRAKNDFSATVDRLKRAIRKKEDWKYKISDPIIRARYIEEAVAQGASKEAIEVALEELDIYENSSDNFDLTKIVDDNLIIPRDGLVPEGLRKSIEKQLDAIADQPNKDFHPGSDEKVQDLIHPSLFPYITEKPPELVDNQSNKKKISSGWRTFPKQAQRPTETSVYQWLPAVFKISKDNKVSISSYINNLDKEEHPQLYQDIAKVFEYHLADVENCVRSYREGPRNQEEEDEDEDLEEEEGVNDDDGEDEDAMEEDKKPKKNPTLIKLKGEGEERELQVIVKACNYILKPGQEYEGVWHVEGMSHEHIAASAIYYYASSPELKDEGLAFRVENNYSYDYGPPGAASWSQTTPLGAIRTPAGRSIIFSNRYQHCVTRLQNTSDKVATRKILCFFVVNPKDPIVSSAQIRPQQWDKMSKKQSKVLLLVAKRLGVTLPHDVVKLILRYAKWGFTWKEATEHRLKLMKERKYFINEKNQQLEREYSLCEH